MLRLALLGLAVLVSIACLVVGVIAALQKQDGRATALGVLSIAAAVLFWLMRQTPL